MAELDTVTIPQLDNLTVALTSYFATSNLNGKLGKSTVADFVTFITPYIKGVGASGFVPITGTVLPPAAANSFSIIGAQTSTQTTGGSIVTTALLNIIVTNGTTWSLVKAIDSSVLVSKAEYNIAVGALNSAVNFGTAIDVTGTKGGNLVAVKTGAVSASGSYESSGFIAVNEGDVIGFTGRMQKTSTIISGLAGYTSAVTTAFVSTTGADGYPIGELVSIDRVAAERGVIPLDSTTSVREYRKVIPYGSGIKFIRGCSAISGDVALKITKYDASTAVTNKAELLTAEDSVRKVKLQLARFKRDYIRASLQPTYTPVTLVLTNDFQVRANFGGVRALTGHKYTDLVDVYAYQMIRVSLTTYGTLGMPDGTQISGIAGYDKDGNFISDLDEFGLPIGTIWSNDRYYQRTGLTKAADAIKLNGIEIVIPEEVAKIRISSQYVGAFATPIVLELGNMFDVKTPRQLVSEVAATAVASVMPGNFQPLNGIKVFAHRGMWRRGNDIIAPENSMDGFALAARFGYKHIEMDTVRTLDGNWIVLHDSTLDRTFNRASDYTAITGVTAATTTLADLRANYVHISSNVRMRRPIPTLFEFLQLCKKFKIIPFVEIKDLPIMTNAKVLEVFNLCKSVLGEEGFYIMTFTNFEFLDYLRTVSKKVKLVYFGNDITRPITAGNSVYAMEYTTITPALVKQAHDAGIEIAGWTVAANNYYMLSNLGVDACIGEGVAPELNNQQIVLTVSSNSDFADFTTNGTLANGVVTLTAGQTLSYGSPAITGLVYSGQYLEVDVKGNCICAISGYNHTTNNTTILDDYMTITHQIIITNNTPSLIFTAGTGGCVIKDVTFKVAKL